MVSGLLPGTSSHRLMVSRPGVTYSVMIRESMPSDQRIYLRMRGVEIELILCWRGRFCSARFCRLNCRSVNMRMKSCGSAVI